MNRKINLEFFNRNTLEVAKDLIGKIINIDYAEEAEDFLWRFYMKEYKNGI